MQITDDLTDEKYFGELEIGDVYKLWYDPDNEFYMKIQSITSLDGYQYNAICLNNGLHVDVENGAIVIPYAQMILKRSI